uniref:C-type lectin domain-containing protein n=1 Tax=Steinernema glaseri TaxID=37863 RepID=A0A1I7ZM46_9BILA
MSSLFAFVLLVSASLLAVNAEEEYSTTDFELPTTVAPRYRMPPQPTANQWIPYKGSLYYHNIERKNWWEAQEWCASQGALLASIHSNEENFIVNFLIEVSLNKQCLKHRQLSQSKAAWIGGYYGNDSTPFQWSDFAPFKYDQVDLHSVLQNRCGPICLAFQSTEPGVPTIFHRNVHPMFTKKNTRPNATKKPTRTASTSMPEHARSDMHWIGESCVEELPFVCKKKQI